MLIVYKYNDDDVCLPLELSDYLTGDSFSYRICNEQNQVIGEGSVGAKDSLTVSGERDVLYMIELRQKESRRAE